MKHYSPRRLLPLLLLVFLLVNIFGATVAAAPAAPVTPPSGLSPEQAKLFQDGILYFNFSDGSSGCVTAGTTLTGSDPEQQTWNYFKGKGLSDAQVAGIMGNLQDEADFDSQRDESGGNSTTQPTNILAGTSPPHSPGWGIAQWTLPYQNVSDLVKQYNVSGPIDSLATQLDLVWAQMNGTSPVGASNMLKGLQQKTDAVSAADYFDSNFEGGVAGVRETDATNILSQYGGTGPSQAQGSGPSQSPGTCVSATTTPDCTTATGDAKILCEAKKYDPVDYVWGGGHAGGIAYHQACPTIEANNSSCGLDCSGLVSVAVYDAFGGSGTLAWDTNSLRADTTHWKSVSFDDLQPGDVIEPDAGHVEIVDHVSGTTVYTFGAHTDQVSQPDQVGPTSYPNADNDIYQYYHYIGPGSS